MANPSSLFRVDGRLDELVLHVPTNETVAP